MTAIQVNNLVKSYRSQNKRAGFTGAVKDLISPNYSSVEAVKGISFSVKEGECVGFIGPNGAGKSTTIKILTGILKPTSGTVQVIGFDPYKDRNAYCQNIGVVFGQRTQLWWDIAVRESFELLRRIYKVSQDDFDRVAGKLIKSFEVEELLSVPVRKLSLGQRMKCDLVASLIHSPKILFLDEPTIGLDTIAKAAIREILRTLNKDCGTTILLTTHDLPEIEELCERIVVIDTGKVIYDGSLLEVSKLYGSVRTLILEISDSLNKTDNDENEKVKFFNYLKRQQGIIEVRPIMTGISLKLIEVDYNRNEITTPKLIETFESTFNIKDISLRDSNIEQIITRMYQQSTNNKSV